MADIKDLKPGMRCMWFKFVRGATFGARTKHSVKIVKISKSRVSIETEDGLIKSIVDPENLDILRE